MNSEQPSVPTFNFTEQEPIVKLLCHKRDLLPDNKCFVLYDVLSRDECEQLIRAGDEYGFLGLNHIYSSNHRNNKRIICENPALLDTLWRRISPCIDKQLTIRGKSDTLHTNFYTSGVWEKHGLNEQFRLCKYDPTNFFKKHQDEGYHPDPKTFRTMKTCMIYLNENFEGGETVFYFGDGSIVSLKPVQGSCIIFDQNILHEGLTVDTGYKYFIRTDVYYKQVEAFELPDLSTVERDALKLWADGLIASEDSDKRQSIQLFTKATRLVPNVDRLYYEMCGDT